MAKNKIIADAVELVKNIPSTDEKALEKFESMEWTDVLLPLEETIEKYPMAEYDIVVEHSLYDFVQAVNKKFEDGWVTCWWVSVVQTNTWIKFYQAIERWNFDSGEKSEMPSENLKADTMGPKPLSIPGLEDEPDLYEDMI